MDSVLEKIDAIRERTGVSYEQAKKTLDAAGGDVVEALIMLERKESEKKDQGPNWTEKMQIQGTELVGKVKELVREGNVRKIVVKQEDRVVFEFPLTLGAIGAIIAPQLAALGAVAALLTKCTIEIERVPPGGTQGEA